MYGDNVKKKVRVHTTTNSVGLVDIAISDGNGNYELELARNVAWPVAHGATAALDGLHELLLLAQAKETD